MNEGQGGLNSGNSALSGSGDFGAFNNNVPVQQPVISSGYTAPQRPMVGNGGYAASVQQPITSSSDYAVPVQQPIMSAPAGVPAGGDDIVIMGSGERKKSWKKWVIGGLVGIGVVGVVALAFLLVGKISASSAEEVREAYWSYMNYLIRGEDSTEVLVEGDYDNVEAAVEVAFDDNDEEYFDKLQSLFDSYYAMAKGRLQREGEDPSELMMGLKDSFDFVVFLRKVGFLNEDELVSEFVLNNSISDLEQDEVTKWASDSETANEYIESRRSFVYFFEEYLASLDAAGCLVGNEINVVCGFGNGIDMSDDMLTLQRKVSGLEESAVSRLNYYSWSMDYQYMEEDYNA